MHKWLLSILLICIICTGLYSKIWIVDNNPNSVGDFTTLADAQTAASNGDTIYVYPSAIAYTGLAISKIIHLFGVGYNLEFYGGQANTTTTKVSSTIDYNAGSEGSTLQGFDGNFNVDINTNNITIKKNNLRIVHVHGSNCMILQNDIVGNVNLDISLQITSNTAGIIIANNKIVNTNTGDAAIYSSTTSTITVINNIISGDSWALRYLSTNSIVQNNIILDGAVALEPVLIYNISNAEQLPPGNGNLINIDMATVFEDPSDYTNGLHLLPGSPAIGAGFNGVDMGIYGGDAPYIDGGFPGLPAIYHLESDVITTPQNGLDVVIKVKSNRE